MQSNMVLAIVYWLHMLATVAWIGGLVALAWLVLPAARRSLDQAGYARLLAGIQKRLNALGWFCLAILTGTGLFQMSGNPNYNGFLAIDNTWAAAILAKHLVIGLMVLIAAYLTWNLLPAMQRETLRQAKGLVESEAAGRLQRREAALLRLNLFLAVVVLALTALARAS